MKTELGLQNGWDEFADSPIPTFSRAGSAQVRNEMSFRTGSSSPFDECLADSSTADTDEGRLSRALQSWMPDHVIRTLIPREKPDPEPVFSGRLGKKSTIFKPAKPKNIKQKKINAPDKRCKTAPMRRVPSDESLVTNLSLMSCSEDDTKQTGNVVKVQIGPRQRKRRVASRASTKSSDEEPVSRWVELASKPKSVLNRLNRTFAMRTDLGLYGGEDLSDESEAFRMFYKDEQKDVNEAGRWTGIKYIIKSSLTRCGSELNLLLKPKTYYQSKLKRTLSASANKGFGKPLELADLKREQMDRLAQEQARIQQERERRKGRRGAMIRKVSATSLTGSVSGSIVGSHASPTATAAPSISGGSEHRTGSSEKGDDVKESVSMWKGDREILEIDLKRELTQRVKQKIDSTRSALKRSTGMGDSNEATVSIGKHDEFPKHVEEDFSHRPKIIQKMRISPHLSDVIHDDIQVRMGRPRYHEIRVTDLEQWNKGQSLNRYHTNLKVFNWLHSLREADFETSYEAGIPDEVPDISIDLELLHVESADEPDVKPLYKAYEVRML